MNESFFKHIEETAKTLLDLMPAPVVLLHHNDADGLSSGRLMLTALSQVASSVTPICLEKPYPRALKEIVLMSVPNSVFVVVDFGSGMLAEFNDALGDTRKLFLLDHHAVIGNPTKSQHLANCVSFNISGREECSASAICGLFSRAIIGEQLGQMDLALLGALGDGQMAEDTTLKGVNAHCFSLARTDELSRDGNTIQFLRFGARSGTEIAKQIDALGSFGYFEDGPKLALTALESGFTEEILKKASDLRKAYTKAFLKFFDESSIRCLEKLDYFSLPESFSRFGVKTVGLVCQDLISEGAIREDVYVAGSQVIPNMIPGIGAIELDEVKISLRTPFALTEKIGQGRALGLHQILPKVASSLGAFLDACHPHAAALTVSRGREEEFFRLFNEEVLSRRP